MISLLLFYCFMPTGAATTIDLSVAEIYGARYLPLAVSDAGTVCLYDNAESQAVVFHPSQMEITRLGRSGKGPGEFIFCDGLIWDRTRKAFALFDQRNQRITLIREDGMIDTMMPVAGMPKLEWPSLLISGAYVFGQPHQGDDFRQQYLKRLDPDTGTVHPLIGYHDTKKPMTFIPNNGQPVVMFAPWDNQYVHAAGSDFVVYQYGQDTHLKLLDAEGGALGAFPHKLGLIAATEAHAEFMIENAAKPFRESLRKHLARPDFWPAVQRILIDDQDRIWVFGQGPGLQRRPIPYHVFGRDGALHHKGRIDHLPAAIMDTRLYAVYDDDETAYLAIYPRILD